MDKINIVVYHKDKLGPCVQYTDIDDKLAEFWQHYNKNILLFKECVFINVKSNHKGQITTMNIKYGNH